MASVFDFTDYKTFNVSTTLISQIFSGGKSLNLEVAMNLAQPLELNPKEVDHFLRLVGTIDARDFDA
jgi:hypothetical protein